MSSNSVDLKNVDIIDSFNINDKYKSLLERYYTQMYCVKINNEKIHPQCILFHSNRICLVTISPKHPIIVENKEIETINFVTSENVDRLKNRVSGKGKRGGQKLEEKSILCNIKCNDGSLYEIYSCINGKLIEINKNLIKNPNLLIRHHNTYGYIGIVLIDLKKMEHTKENLISEEYFQELKLENI